MVNTRKVGSRAIGGGRGVGPFKGMIIYYIPPYDPRVVFKGGFERRFICR